MFLFFKSIVLMFSIAEKLICPQKVKDSEVHKLACPECLALCKDNIAANLGPIFSGPLCCPPTS